jgi:predicted ATP-grasp superfamily ATP-dependent carboligase
MLAEAAAHDGCRAVALDLFGDVDTRRAAAQWLPIGAPDALRIDGPALMAALHGLVRRGGGEVIGWIPGGGFEGRPELIDAGAEVLPLIGTPARAVRRLRDPVVFFDALAAHGIDHPEVQTVAPADPEGWLRKDAAGCGGWHIRHANAATGSTSGSAYFQRAWPGRPMSATFIANGRDALLVGFNELIVRPFGAHPFVYAGCIGPVPVAPAVANAVGHAVRTLTAEFGLRGWCSLDFIDDDGRIGVLEVNPRPPATMALYGPRGLIDAQLQACLRSELPSPARFAGHPVRGHEIVYARRPFTLGAQAARRLVDRPDTHDLPHAGTAFSAGDPVCSLSAEAVHAEQVRALLTTQRDALRHTLETEHHDHPDRP